MLKLIILPCLLLNMYLLFGANHSTQSSTDSIGYLYEFDMKYYGSNSNLDPNYQYVLTYLVETLEKDTALFVHVRGHVCCGPGKRLSKKRARKVYRFLVHSGINKSRVSYKGYSNNAPLVFPEKKESDEIINRRVDFIIYYFVN